MYENSSASSHARAALKQAARCSLEGTLRCVVSLKLLDIHQSATLAKRTEAPHLFVVRTMRFDQMVRPVPVVSVPMPVPVVPVPPAEPAVVPVALSARPECTVSVLLKHLGYIHEVHSANEKMSSWKVFVEPP